MENNNMLGKKHAIDNNYNKNTNDSINNNILDNTSSTNFIKNIDLNNDNFNKYYKINLSQYFKNAKNTDSKLHISDFDEFLDKLKEKLPCVFRVNPSLITNNSNFVNIFKEESKLNKEFFNNISNNTIKVNEFKLCSNSNLVFKINIPKTELKKNIKLKKFHKYLQLSVDAGMISRQEAVSMIPPYLLDIQKGMKVLDMCAAPGSKTGQFVEKINIDYDYFLNNDNGIVIANDNNFTRAYMMTHQLQRYSTSDLLVVSHDAQNFPFLFKNYLDEDTINNNNQSFEIKATNVKLKFDRILADVPCSSDAVMRKLPYKWKKWSTKDAYNLHKLQLNILKRGLLMLNDNGLIVYSTCSLNPVENEAVVAEALKLYGDSIEIVNCSNYFENTDIKYREGLTDWTILTEDENNQNKNSLIEISSINSDEYKKYSHLIAESCFNTLKISSNSHKLNELKNCVRILPHDSDTSGFFITLIKKKYDLKDKLTNLETTINDKRNIEIKLKGGVVLKDYGISLLSKQKHSFEINWLTNYYGFKETFPFNQLATHSDKTKKINFLSNGVYKYIKNDYRQQIKIITAGVRMFNQTKSNFKDESECRYRICQDGVMYAFPYMTKRLFLCCEELFKYLLENSSVKIEEIKNYSKEKGLKYIENLLKYFNETSTGCIVLIVLNKENSILDSNELNSDYINNYLNKLNNNSLLVKENIKDVISCYLSKSALSLQISKEYMHMFSTKYNVKVKALDSFYNTENKEIQDTKNSNNDNNKNDCLNIDLNDENIQDEGYVYDDI